MMKNLLLIFMSAGFLFLCCEEKKDSAKEGVLDETQLSALLIDIYLAEAVADNLPLVKDSAMTFFAPQERKLLKKKNISDSVLKKTYSYYLAHPKEFEKVFEIVIDSLTLREQRTNKAHENAAKPHEKALKPN
jgi:hypothetical protein